MWQKSIRYTLSLVFVFLPLIWSLPVSAQTNINWKELAQVHLREMYDLNAGVAFLKPRFDKSLRKLDGKPIRIKGYVLPLDAERNTYALSANPFASCFFCGNAGLESVMELSLAQAKRRFRIDELRTFQGVLVLNKSPNGLIYRLVEASVIE